MKKAFDALRLEQKRDAPSLLSSLNHIASIGQPCF